MSKRKTQPKAKVKQKVASKKRPVARKVVAEAKHSKTKVCLDLLARKEGAMISELQSATGWQQHSVRGFLAGKVKKLPGMMLTSEKLVGQPRRYHVIPA